MEVLELVARPNREREITIVLVLHDLNQAARYAHRMVVQQSGAIVCDGEPIDVLRPELLASVFGVQANILIDPASGTPVCLPYAIVARGEGQFSSPATGEAVFSTHKEESLSDALTA